MNKIKKHFIIFLGLIISLLPSQNNLVFAEKSKDKAPGINTKLSYDKLQSNPDWIKLAQIWKDLNNVKPDTNNIKTYDGMLLLQRKLDTYFNNLIKAHLITQDDKTLLIDLFDRRFNDLKFRMGMTTCYEPLPAGDNPASAGMDLEERYQILKKLAAENRINSETYKLTKSQIEKDIRIIKGSKKQKIDNQFVDLIYYLSK